MQFSDLFNKSFMFMPSLCVLDPNEEIFNDIIQCLIDNDVQALNLNLAFNEASADSFAAQEAMHRALNANTNTHIFFKKIKQIKQLAPHIALNVYAYGNNIVAYGEQSFFSSCIDSQVDSLLLADIPALMLKHTEHNFIKYAQNKLKFALTIPYDFNDELLKSIKALNPSFVIFDAPINQVDDNTLKSKINKIKSYNLEHIVFRYIEDHNLLLKAKSLGADGVISNNKLFELIAKYHDNRQALLDNIQAYLKDMHK